MKYLRIQVTKPIILFCFLLIGAILLFREECIPSKKELQKILSQMTSGRNDEVTNKSEEAGSPDIILLPDDVRLGEMSETQHVALFQRYITSIQAICRNIRRIGVLHIGGKEICVDEAYKPKQPCLVYSFGINNEWEFDQMVEDVFGCEVHCFDPSMKRNTGRVSEKIWFYNIGLGDRDWIDERGWPIKTLKTIRKILKHENRTIDILKIDIEGDEWKAIPDMIKSGALDDVKQIPIEIHFSRIAGRPSVFWGHVHSKDQLSVLRQLYEAGFRIFMRERNLYEKKIWPPFKYPLTNTLEVCFLRPV